MGMDATVSIWVGLRERDCDLSEIEDSRLDEIWCSDEKCGVGIEVFRHDWDFGEVAFNVEDVARDIEEASLKLEAIFEELGIKHNFGVWCQTDFS